MSFLSKEPSTLVRRLSRRVIQLSVSNHRRQAIPDIRMSVIAIPKFMFLLCGRKAVCGLTIFILKCLMWQSPLSKGY